MSTGRPIFNLNEPPAADDMDNDGVFCFQPHRAVPSSSTLTSDLQNLHQVNLLDEGYPCNDQALDHLGEQYEKLKKETRANTEKLLKSLKSSLAENASLLDQIQKMTRVLELSRRQVFDQQQMPTLQVQEGEKEILAEEKEVNEVLAQVEEEMLKLSSELKAAQLRLADSFLLLRDFAAAERKKYFFMGVKVAYRALWELMHEKLGSSFPSFEAFLEKVKEKNGQYFR